MCSAKAAASAAFFPVTATVGAFEGAKEIKGSGDKKLKGPAKVAPSPLQVSHAAGITPEDTPTQIETPAGEADKAPELSDFRKNTPADSAREFQKKVATKRKPRSTVKTGGLGVLNPALVRKPSLIGA